MVITATRKILTLAAIHLMAFQTASAACLDIGAVHELFDQAILEDESIDGLIARYDQLGGETSATDEDRANAYLTAAHLHWRYGQVDKALNAVDKALAQQRTTDATLLKARLLDATGDAEGASQWYERALATTDSAGEREFIRIRMTMIEVDERNVSALVDLASERDREFKNRAAVALAVLGHSDRAIELYRPKPSLGKLFQQHIRRAEWAIAAGDLALAQNVAWTAYESAKARTDILYALTVLLEAYRKDDALARLIETIDQRGDLNDDMLQLRVDLLIETEQYDEAIAFYQALSGAAADIRARQRLINLYDTAGRTPEMIAEYRRLMAAEPEVVYWYSGLSAHYMNIAEPEQALDVWKTLEESNSARIDVLVEAGGQMLDMGFVSEATGMIERHMSAYGVSVQGLMFLFETYFSRGRDAEALSALTHLEEALPPGSGDLRVVADGYERLNRDADALRVYERLRESEGRLGYDERMRLAWLYSVVGEKQKALETWQAIWVSVDSPARRTFAESQFLQLSAEMNMLADIVVDLEDKLYRQTANKNDINLLVRIYTEVGDTFSATEVIDEYAKQSGGSEIDKLTQIGRVYLQLSEYSQYDRMLRRLEKIDKENRVEHIQNIVLNMLAFDLAEGSSERFDEIQHWLGELREYDAEAVSGEFEASILAMGGFHEEAIESYRRALVEQPEHSDNLLLMADLMKEAGRTDEAVSLLQYVAEHAEDDNEFVVAVDGIINMIGQRRFREELTPKVRNIFRWTHRIILERITGRDDRFYLYRLLADIAQETNNKEAEYAAVENSLSLAGIRRASILRELVTMSTPGAGFFAFFGDAQGDTARQLTYGRRLIGLRQQLPPEVYISVGEALLEQGDTQSAEKAFDMINDITGMIDVNKTKAGLFQAAGYSDQALSYYNRALSVDRDDLELLLKAAVLRESIGQDVVANSWYFRALTNLLHSQPAVLRNDSEKSDPHQPPFSHRRADTAVNRDYRAYYEVLAQGFLITWPHDPVLAGERIDGLERLFDEELANVVESFGDGEPLPLARYSRLDHIAQFMRRVARRTSNPELAEYADLGLLAHFMNDAEYAREIAEQYRDWGLRELAASAAAQAGIETQETAGESLLLEALEKEKSNGNFETAVKLARLADDEDGLNQMFRDRIAGGKYREGFAYAKSVLSDGEYLRFISSIAPTLKDSNQAFIQLLVEDADLVRDLERRISRELISTSELFDLLDTKESWDYLSDSFYGMERIWSYVKSKAGLDEQVQFLQHVADRTAERKFAVLLTVPKIIKEILIQKLTSSQQQSFYGAATAFLSKQDFKNEFAKSAVAGVVLNLDAHPDNLNLLYDLADFWQARVQGGFEVKPVIREAFEGSDDRAFEELLKLHKGGVLGEGVRHLRPLVNTHFAASHARLLDSLRRGDDVDAEIARTVYELEYLHSFSPANAADSREQARLLQQLIQSYPRDDRYRRELIFTYFKMGERLPAERALADYYEYDPGDEFVRAAYYFHLLAGEKFEKALAVTTDGGPDLRDEGVIAELNSRTSSSAGIYRRVSGTSRRRHRFAPWGDHITREIEWLRELVSGQDAEKTRLALRAVWRGSLTSLATADRNFFGSNPYGALLRIPLDADGKSVSDRIRSLASLIELGDQADPELLFEAIAEDPDNAVELENFLVSMSADQRRRSNELYGLVADSYGAGGHRDSRLDELGFRLRDGVMNDCELTLWMLLREQTEDELSSREMQDFAGRVAAGTNLTNLQLLAAARIFAQGGWREYSIQHYLLLAARQLKHGEFGDQAPFFSYDSGNQDPQAISLSELIDDAALRLPEEDVLGLARNILSIAARADDELEYGYYYDAFVLMTLAKLLPVSEVLAAAEEFSPNVGQLNIRAERGEAPKAIELARLHVRSEDFVAALAALRPLLTVQPATRDSRLAGPFDAAQRKEFEINNNLLSLARIYGLPSLAAYFGHSSASNIEQLVNLRERIFPSQQDEEAWTSWQQEAADAIFSSLDQDDSNSDSALETVFLIAYQLDKAGQSEVARKLVNEAAGWIASNRQSIGAVSMQNLSVSALHIGVALPSELTREILAQGGLTVEQEVSLIAALAESGDTETALEVGRSADYGTGKLSLMQKLKPLAEAAGDEEYATDLQRRINAAEAAKGQIGVESLQTANIEQ